MTPAVHFSADRVVVDGVVPTVPAVLHGLAVAPWPDTRGARRAERDPAGNVTVHARWPGAAPLRSVAGYTVRAGTAAGSADLWPETPVADTDFARHLLEQQHVTVLPGRFLARESEGINPGENRVRIALVAETADCVEAAQRIKAALDTL